MELHCFIAALDLVQEIKPDTIVFFHNDSVVHATSEVITVTKDMEDEYLYKASLAIADINFAYSGTYHCKHKSRMSREPVSIEVLPIINCQWSHWKGWTSCSHTCGGGLRNRARHVLVNAANGGLNCEGSDTDSGDCNTQDCPEPGKMGDILFFLRDGKQCAGK